AMCAAALRINPTYSGVAGTAKSIVFTLRR
ncbi:MAG: hypothetical protein RLZZ483_309, partial [Actinomycetota bacterium]